MINRRATDSDRFSEEWSEPVVSESPEEFLARRQRLAGDRRRAVVLIAGLSVTCLLLAVANVILAVRLMTTPAAGPAPSEPLAQTATDPGRTAEEPAPVPAAPVQAAPMASPTDDRTTATTSPADPARSGPVARSEERPELPATRDVRSSATPDPDRARRIATWMIAAYGPHVAEERVRAAASFYDAGDPAARQWRSVLAEIRRAR